MRRRWVVTTVSLVALMLLAACGGGESVSEPAPPVSTETGEADTAEALEPAAETSLEVQLQEQNGSDQTGTAILTPSPQGIEVVVEVDSADVAQYALIASGTCEALEEPFASIESAGEQELTGGTKSGRFEEAELVAYDAASPVTLADLEGSFAVLVVDAAYRGGVGEEIPPDVHMFKGSDPTRPFSEVPYPIAACGDIPTSS